MAIRAAFDGTVFEVQPASQSQADLDATDAEAERQAEQYRLDNIEAWQAWFDAQQPPPPPENTWTNLYSFMLLFRADERARYRSRQREAALLPVELSTERHALLDTLVDFDQQFDRLPNGVNRADPATAASMQLFVALEIVAPAEAAWRIPQILAGLPPTETAPEA